MNDDESLTFGVWLLVIASGLTVVFAMGILHRLGFNWFDTLIGSFWAGVLMFIKLIDIIGKWGKPK